MDVPLGPTSAQRRRRYSGAQRIAAFARLFTSPPWTVWSPRSETASADSAPLGPAQPPGPGARSRWPGPAAGAASILRRCLLVGTVGPPAGAPIRVNRVGTPLLIGFAPLSGATQDLSVLDRPTRSMPRSHPGGSGRLYTSLKTLLTMSTDSRQLAALLLLLLARFPAGTWASALSIASVVVSHDSSGVQRLCQSSALSLLCGGPWFTVSLLPLVVLVFFPHRAHRRLARGHGVFQPVTSCRWRPA